MSILSYPTEGFVFKDSKKKYFFCKITDKSSNELECGIFALKTNSKSNKKLIDIVDGFNLKNNEYVYIYLMEESPYFIYFTSGYLNDKPINERIKEDDFIGELSFLRSTTEEVIDDEIKFKTFN